MHSTKMASSFHVKLDEYDARLQLSHLPKMHLVTKTGSKLAS